eukprot:g3358.t1
MSNSSRSGAMARDCRESFRRIRMKIKNSERLDRAREQMRQKARDLKKRGADLKEAAAANPTLRRLREKMKRAQEEEEKRNKGPSQEEVDFNNRMYYDFMKSQKEAARRQEMEYEKTRARIGNLSIHRASELGNNPAIQRLLDIGEGKRIQPDSLSTPLHAAASRGKLDACKLLVEQARADLNARDKFGCTPLCRAAAAGHLSVVRWFIETAVGAGGVRADENITSFWNGTLLHFAVEGGHLEVSRYLLLRRGADVLAQTHSLETPYHVMCRCCTFRVRERALNDMRGMLHEYITMAMNEDIAALDTNLDGVDNEESALLNRINIAKQLVSLHNEWLDSLKGDLLEEANKIKTLFDAAHAGRCVFLDDLFSDPEQRELATDIRDETHGRSLLHIAAKSGNCNLAELLFDSTYLDPLDPDGKGRTALHLAALYGHSNMVSLLLENAQPAGPEGWDMLTSAKDSDGKRASDLICQRWKPILAPGAKMPPAGVVRAEKIRIRTDLEYVLDPERAGREEAQLEELDTFENQVNLSQFYHQSGLKAPKWIRDNADEINSKLGDARALKRAVETRLKRKKEFEKRRKEREKFRRAELAALSKHATTSRKKLKRLLHEIEFKQVKKIGWAESRLAEVRPKLSKARTFLANEEAFRNTVHVRVKAVVERSWRKHFDTQGRQAEAWQVEEGVEEQKIKEAKEEWLISDDKAKEKVVRVAEIEQLDIRLDAARDRYKSQLDLKIQEMTMLEAGMVPEQAVLDKLSRQYATGQKIDWKLTRRRGKNFMNAGRTVKVNLTEKEREKAGLTAENIRIQLAKDRKRLEFGKDAIQEKQKAWLMSNGKLWFEFASDHVGREIQRCKQNLHRKCKEEIDELERKLQAAEERVTNLSQKLKHEKKIKTEEFETRCSKYGCLRWWRGAAIALIANLEEDVEEAVALESSLRNQIRNAKQSEINGHKDLQRQEEEAIKMLRSDVGSDILDGKIPDAIEMPFVSDSESSEGSAANSDLDIIQDDISEHSEDAVDVGSISSSEPSSL